MFANLTGWHALILIVVVLLLFGATRLPALAKSVGQSVKILKKETAADPKADTAAGAGGETIDAAPIEQSHWQPAPVAASDPQRL